MDRRTLFYRTLVSGAGGPIKGCNQESIVLSHIIHCIATIHLLLKISVLCVTRIKFILRTGKSPLGMRDK